MRYRTKLIVDLKLLGENYHQLRKIAPANHILFMVKANGYGYGMLPIVRYAVENLQIKEFGLATTGEARYLRQELSDLQFEAYVFSDVQIDTNHEEREIRSIAMGRKNWNFCWTEIGAQYVGIMQSLIRTCILHQVNPYHYLVDVFQRIDITKKKDVQTLTPRLWKEHYQHSRLKSDIDTA